LSLFEVGIAFALDLIQTCGISHEDTKTNRLIFFINCLNGYCVVVYPYTHEYYSWCWWNIQNMDY